MKSDFKKLLFSFRYPRLQGIKEHYLRANKYMKLAKRCKNIESRYRNLITAIYPARAIVEIMLESVENEDIESFKSGAPKKDRADFENKISAMLPYYYLVEKLRIHDFHRFGIIPPNPRLRQVSFGGKIKLVAQSGGANIQVKPNGLEKTITGKSSIIDQRGLLNINGLLQDEETGKMVSLEHILNCYIKAVPSVIKFYESMLKQ